MGLCLSFNNDEELTFRMIDSLLHNLFSPSRQSIAGLPPSELFDDILTILFQNPSLLSRYAQLSPTDSPSGMLIKTLQIFLKRFRLLKDQTLSSSEISRLLCVYVKTTIQEMEKSESATKSARNEGNGNGGKLNNYYYHYHNERIAFVLHCLIPASFY